MILPVVNNSNRKYPHDSSLIAHIDASIPQSYSGTGTIWNDLSPNNLGSATLTVAPTFSSAPTNINYFNFNGSTQYCSFKSLTATSTQNMTFIAWLSSGSAQSSYAGIIFSRVANSNAMGMSVGGTNTLLGWTWIANFGNFTGLTLPTNSWYMAAVTYSPTTATGYINTNAPVAVTSTISPTTLSSILLANDNFGGRFWKGNIAIASIYNRTLSQTEITKYYNTYKGRFGLT